MTSWMVTMLRHENRREVPTVATRLPAEEAHRYPLLIVRIEDDGVVSTMVRMDDCKKAEAMAAADTHASALLRELGARDAS